MLFLLTLCMLKHTLLSWHKVKVRRKDEVCAAADESDSSVIRTKPGRKPVPSHCILLHSPHSCVARSPPFLSLSHFYPSHPIHSFFFILLNFLSRSICCFCRFVRFFSILSHLHCSGRLFKYLTVYST